VRPWEGYLDGVGIYSRFIDPEEAAKTARDTDLRKNARREPSVFRDEALRVSTPFRLVEPLRCQAGVARQDIAGRC
jgi:hypothetical protein